MSNNTSPLSLMEGRPVTAVLVFGAGIGSAAFNVYGAHAIYAGIAGLIFGGVVLCMEGLAIVSLRHILEDWDNNNYVKAGLGAIAFAGIVSLCMYSGYRAFNGMNIEATETNNFEKAKADRIEAAGNAFFAEASTLTGQAKDTQLFYGEKKLKEANDIRIEVQKKQPPAFAAVMLFLATLELVKMIGRFALATPSQKKWSWTRRQIEKAKERERLAIAKAAADDAESNIKAFPVRG